MKPLSHEGSGAVGAPPHPGAPTPTSADDDTLPFWRGVPFVDADAALAVLAYATNQVVAGHVAVAHHWGDLVRAQSRELSAAGAIALPSGVLRDAVTTIASIEASFADNVIAAANRYGRRYAHIAFAFPVLSRDTH